MTNPHPVDYGVRVLCCFSILLFDSYTQISKLQSIEWVCGTVCGHDVVYRLVKFYNAISGCGFKHPHGKKVFVLKKSPHLEKVGGSTRCGEYLVFRGRAKYLVVFRNVLLDPTIEIVVEDGFAVFYMQQKQKFALKLR